MILTLIQTQEQIIACIVFPLEWEEQPWVGWSERERDKTEEDPETEIEGDGEEQESG